MKCFHCKSSNVKIIEQDFNETINPDFIHKYISIDCYNCGISENKIDIVPKNNEIIYCKHITSIEITCCFCEMEKKYNDMQKQIYEFQYRIHRLEENEVKCWKGCDELDEKINNIESKNNS